MGLPQYDPRLDFSAAEDNVVDGQLVMDAIPDEQLFEFYRHCAATDDAIFQEAVTSKDARSLRRRRMQLTMRREAAVFRSAWDYKYSGQYLATWTTGCARFTRRRY